MRFRKEKELVAPPSEVMLISINYRAIKHHRIYTPELSVYDIHMRIKPSPPRIVTELIIEKKVTNALNETYYASDSHYPTHYAEAMLKELAGIK